MRIEDVVAVIFLGVIYGVLRWIFKRVLIEDLKLSTFVFIFLLCCLFFFDLRKMFFALLAMWVSDVIYFHSNKK